MVGLILQAAAPSSRRFTGPRSSRAVHTSLNGSCSSDHTCCRYECRKERGVRSSKINERKWLSGNKNKQRDLLVAVVNLLKPFVIVHHPGAISVAEWRPNRVKLKGFIYLNS